MLCGVHQPQWLVGSVKKQVSCYKPWRTHCKVVDEDNYHGSGDGGDGDNVDDGDDDGGNDDDNQKKCRFHV